MLVLVGVAMISRRWQLPGWVQAAIVGVFFVSAAVGGAYVPSTVHSTIDRVQALQHTKDVVISPAQQYILAGPDTNYVYIKDSQSYLEYSYYGNLETSKIKVSSVQGVLHIDTGGVTTQYHCNTFCFSDSPELMVSIHGPAPTAISIRGDDSDFSTGDALPASAVTVDVARNSHLDLGQSDVMAAVVTASRTGTNHAVLTLSGNSSQNGTSFDSALFFGSVQRLTISTSDLCDNGDSYIITQSNLQQLTVNGKTIDAAHNFATLMKPDRQTAGNCISVQPAMSATSGEPISPDNLNVH
jgi:hypothetical protein